RSRPWPPPGHARGAEGATPPRESLRPPYRRGEAHLESGRARPTDGAIPDRPTRPSVPGQTLRSTYSVGGQIGEVPRRRNPGASSVTDLVAARHIGPRPAEREHLLATVGYPSLDALVDAAVPPAIRESEPLDLPPALTEPQMLEQMRALAAKNRRMTQMIGQGYYPTVTPAVIRRNVLEDPAWYTAYTPYQPEISQGRLEALLNFQTMVADLTALPVAQASLLDEATAVAEAVALMHRAARKDGVVLIDSDLFPQSLDVTLARAEAAGLAVRVVDLERELLGAGTDDGASSELAGDGAASELAPTPAPRDVTPSDAAPDADLPVLGIVVQQPGASGRVRDLAPL